MLKPLTRTQREGLEAATAACETHVGAVEEYLAGRGITMDVARMYRLGFVDDPVVKGFDQYRGRLAIPYITRAGVVDIRFRALGESSAKYLSRPGAEPTLYNVEAFFRPGDRVVICEGELDALTMDGLCGLPAVGCPGVNNWKDYWGRLFADYHSVFVLCDGDDAGRTFGAKIAKQLDNAVVIHLPDGHDVNSLYLAHGRDHVRALVGM